jgi:hypothetical protein
VPFLVLPGNHDSHHPDSVWTSKLFVKECPDNLVVLLDEPVSVGGVEFVGAPLTYDLELDLTEQRRVEGVLEVSSWTGRAERAVLLPHVADLSTDHVDSALPRANAIMPGVRRTLLDETMDPVLEVEAPAREWDPDRAVAALPF